jgi:streptomycin 3"-adenylyltransferase
MSATLDTNSAAYVRTVAEHATAILDRALVGTYLHGSAVLGGFAPTRSDLDLLVVTTGPLDAPTKQQLATTLAPTRCHVPPCGGWS